MFNRFYSKFDYNPFLNILEDARFAYISTSFTFKHGLQLGKHLFFGTMVCVPLTYVVLFISGRTFSILL